MDLKVWVRHFGKGGRRRQRTFCTRNEVCDVSVQIVWSEKTKKESWKQAQVFLVRRENELKKTIKSRER